MKSWTATSFKDERLWIHGEIRNIATALVLVVNVKGDSIQTLKIMLCFDRVNQAKLFLLVKGNEKGHMGAVVGLMLKNIAQQRQH